MPQSGPAAREFAAEEVAGPGSRPRALLEVLQGFLALGFTAFGGPNAHLGFFQRELVERRRWIDAPSYAELVALCQFLPGPASSQVGIALGTYRAGLLGGVTAWLAFTLPSALAMIAFAYGIGQLGVGEAGWIKGLKAAAVAVVANAAWQMGVQLAPDRGRRVLLCVAAVVAALWRDAAAQVGIIAVAGVVGLLTFRPAPQMKALAVSSPLSRRFGLVCLALFFLLLVGLPVARAAMASPWLAQFESFYRVGSLVFGGGHVVLPLIEMEVVGSGWVSRDEFLAGYGAVQAVPGPLFTFAAYLGAVMREGGGGLIGGLWTLVAVFVPSFLLIFGALPFWDGLRARPRVGAALMGVNAAVVGLVVAALHDPMWVTAVHGSVDFAVVVGAFCTLVFLRWPAWLVVVSAGLAGALRDLPWLGA